MRLIWGSVTAVREGSTTVQRLDVSRDDGTATEALCFTMLVGPSASGDRVLLNTTAVDLELGTGGADLVVARAGEGVALDDPSGGHIMKVRYTPLQRDVLAVESQESRFHGVMAAADDVGAMPVVCCGLHSQAPLVAAALRSRRPDARIVYCMTDDAALPYELSEVARAATAAGLIDQSITCGQAFGGGLEAVNLHSGLLAARHVAEADVAVVAIGPGIAGTSTPFGHGGVSQGEAINAVSVLGGVPVACLRLSFADPRQRHQGVSHHTLVALARVALAPATVAVPGLPEARQRLVDDALELAGVWSRHRRADAFPVGSEPPAMLGVEVRTMGRGFADDPAFFAGAYAAGDVAADLLGS
jgi:hypothetical protein